MRRCFLVLAGLAVFSVGQGECVSDADGDGYVGLEDCDDANPEVFPGAIEQCNGIDDDCDRGVDEDFDSDQDGFTTCDVEGNPADCDDEFAGTYPGAPELCDGLDNNCDDMVDEVFDLDNDGYTICSGDCEDDDPNVNPAATEICDFVDNNCDGKIDEGFDRDHDGFTTCNGDCNDFDPTTHVGATDRCDGVDNDCNGIVDDNFDEDDDGVTSCGGDCNDSNPSIYPDAQEVCDRLDNDCDGLTDEGVTPTWYLDADEDGYGSPQTVVEACAAPSDVYIRTGGDCNDLDPDVHPKAPETCDGVDEDCDGVIDEGFDRDGDGSTSCGGDCNDGNSSIYPGAPDICDGIDSNCDGVAEGRCYDPIAELDTAVEGEGSGVVGISPYGYDPLAVHFDATSSYDPDGGTLRFEWNFGDGSVVRTVPVVEHIYHAATPDGVNTYNAKLTVTDDEGKTDTRSIAVRVCGSEYPDTCAPF